MKKGNNYVPNACIGAIYEHQYCVCVLWQKHLQSLNGFKPNHGGFSTNASVAVTPCVIGVGVAPGASRCVVGGRTPGDWTGEWQRTRVVQPQRRGSDESPPVCWTPGRRLSGSRREKRRSATRPTDSRVSGFLTRRVCDALWLYHPFQRGPRPESSQILLL